MQFKAIEGRTLSFRGEDSEKVSEVPNHVKLECRDNQGRKVSLFVCPEVNSFEWAEWIAEKLNQHIDELQEPTGETPRSSHET